MKFVGMTRLGAGRFFTLVAFAGVLIAVRCQAFADDSYHISSAENMGLAATPTTCQTLLGNNLYSCQVESAFGPFHDCFQFSSPGAISGNFDLQVAQLGGNGLGCSCKVTGSFQKPHFNMSHSFDCVAAGGDTSPSGGFTFEGTATKTKITGGFVASSFGTTWKYTCVVDPTCVP